MRVVFFGTPHFAVPTLDALVASGHAPALVVSQPSRPVGRGRRLAAPPVAEAAVRHGIEVVQPQRVRDPEFMVRLADLAPDVAVVVAFGQIFRQELLGLPRLGCVNLHASLLPRWRGAAPIQAAIAAGDPTTGVTTMQMDVGLDSGPMLLEETVTIEAEETTPALAQRLASIGGPLVVRTLEGLADGSLVPRAQDENAVTRAPMLTKADGVVDWRLPARTIYDRWRAFVPWPGSTADFDGRPLKLIEMQWASDDASITPSNAGIAPGAVSANTDGTVDVVCGDGARIRLLRVQRPNRPAVGASYWRNGEHIADGATFDVARADGADAPTEAG